MHLIFYIWSYFYFNLQFVLYFSCFLRYLHFNLPVDPLSDKPQVDKNYQNVSKDVEENDLSVLNKDNTCSDCSDASNNSSQLNHIIDFRLIWFYPILNPHWNSQQNYWHHNLKWLSEKVHYIEKYQYQINFKKY